MREILFRGKQAYNDEWAFSEYPFGTIHCGIVVHDFIPETVGQYTGRNVGADKLYEGDIIEWIEDYDDNWGDSKTYIGRSLVIWDNDNSCWAVKTDTYIQFFNDFSWDRCYVIGNIHDNPELLEVK